MTGKELFEKKAKELQYDQTWNQLSDALRGHWERKAKGLPTKPLSCPNPECKSERVFVNEGCVICRGCEMEGPYPQLSLGCADKKFEAEAIRLWNLLLREIKDE